MFYIFYLLTYQRLKIRHELRNRETTTAADWRSDQQYRRNTYGGVDWTGLIVDECTVTDNQLNSSEDFADTATHRSGIHNELLRGLWFVHRGQQLRRRREPFQQFLRIKLFRWVLQHHIPSFYRLPQQTVSWKIPTLILYTNPDFLEKRDILWMTYIFLCLLSIFFVFWLFTP